MTVRKKDKKARLGEPGRRRAGGATAVLGALLLTFSVHVHADQALEDRVRAISSELRCVVCQNLSVADSPAEMAVQMRGIVREQLQAGKTPDEVRAYFVSKYGEWVLLAPTAQGFNLTVWILPFVVLLAGLAFAAWYLRRWSRRRTREPEGMPDPALLERVRAAVAAGEETAGSPGSANPPIYQDLRELEFDHQAGKLSDADYASLKQRYERQAVELLREAGDAAAAVPEPDAREPEMTEPTPSRWSKRSWMMAGGAALLLAGGVTLGLLLGQSVRPRTSPEDSMTGDFLTGTGPGGIGQPGASNPAAALRQGQEAFQRKDFKAAIQAFQTVLRRDPGHPAANAYMGMILAQAGHVEAALEALDRALARTPNFPLALWAKGMVLFQDGRDPAGAREHLERLEGLLPQGEQRNAVRDIIARIGEQAPEPAGAPAERRIEGTVELEAGHAPGTGARAVLYIIARPAGAQGGPPLAVKRIVAPAFPVSFSLGPNDVMIQGTAFEGPLNLTARLDRDGDPLTREAGEPAGAHDGNPVSPGARNVVVKLR
ncbi:MAG: cytochrome c-type biogenesis protein CcmH [Deltaproteobacteria bacterium]|nr:cytochrome c-type biogenesis protein CcmH [Deltaproteobacteria bacterium]